jgi:hypothetical protein
MKCLVALLSILIIALAGCSQSTGSESEHGVSTSITDPETGVQLQVNTSESTLLAADRLTVSVRAEWEAPYITQIVEPDWSASGWTLIMSSIHPVDQSENKFHQSATYLLEPFLPGEYSVPSIGAQIQSTETDLLRTLVSADIDIEVRSILNDDDQGIIKPAGGFILPLLDDTEPDSNSFYLYAAVGFGFVLLIAFLWLKARGSKERIENESLFSILNRVAHDPQEDIQSSYDDLYNALSMLDDRLYRTSEIQSMIQTCEQVRFSDGHQVSVEPSLMAQHTLELLGNSMGERV